MTIRTVLSRPARPAASKRADTFPFYESTYMALAQRERGRADRTLSHTHVEQAERGGQKAEGAATN